MRRSVSWSWAFLGLVVSAPAWAQPRTTVALDLSALDTETFEAIDALGLEKRVIVRLVQDGYAVVSLSAAPDVVLTVSPTNSGLVLRARGPRGVASREIPMGPGSVAEMHLEICQKLVVLGRAVLPPRGGSSAGSVDIAVGIEALIRPSGSDAQLRAELHLRLGSQWAVALRGAVSPSVQAGIQVMEWIAQGGVSRSFVLAERIELEIGLALGLLIHHYTVEDPSASNRSGTRWAFVASLPLELSWWPIRSVALTARTAPRLATPTYSHTRHGQTIWERGSAGIEVGAGVVWRF